jgi:hypothetical protein
VTDPEKKLAEMRLRLLELEEEEEASNPPAQAQRKVPTVGEKETFINSFGEAVPGGRTSTNFGATLALQAGKLFGLGSPGVKFTDRAKAEIEAAGTPAKGQEEVIPGFLETYRRVRGERADRVEAGEKQNPWSGGLGTGAGIVTSLAAPAANLFGPGGWAGRLGNAALTGGAYGALSKADMGQADLTEGEWGRFASEVSGVEGMRDAAQSFRDGSYGRGALDLVGAGFLGGATTGAAVSGAVEGVKKLGATELFRRTAIKKTKDVLQGGSDIAAPSRVPLSDEAAEEVLRSKALGATTADTYAKIEDQASDLGAVYGKIIDGLEAEGVRGPEAKALADKLMQRFREEWTMAPANKAVPQAYADEAENLLAITGPAPGVQGPSHPLLGLRQSEGLKQRLQTQARFERLNNNPAELARQEISSMVRQANEEAIEAAAQRAGAGSETARLAADFVPTKQRLGRLLEARTAAEKGAVKAAAKPSGPGLPDYLLGATTGNPAAGYITALASKSLRSRLPAAMARSSYGAMQSLEGGSAAPQIAKYLQYDIDDEPTPEERREALIRALQAPRSQ